MKTDFEYILDKTGTVLRRDITERELDLGDKLVAALTKNAVQRIPRVTEIEEYGIVGMVAAPQAIYWTVPVSRLMIRAPWRLINDVLVPHFNSNSDPVMSVPWNVPEDMKLKILVMVSPYTETHYCMSGMWLFALNQKGATFRLPLANVHDDCMVCHGQKDIVHETAFRVLETALKRFETSKYNADLWKNAEATQKFFRVKPGKKDEFEQQPIQSDTGWESLCLKVASANSKMLI